MIMNQEKVQERSWKPKGFTLSELSKHIKRNDPIPGGRETRGVRGGSQRMSSEVLKICKRESKTAVSYVFVGNVEEDAVL